MTYDLYHLRIDGRTVEMRHGHDLPQEHIDVCDQWLSYERAKRHVLMRQLKQTHGRGDAPELEAIR